MKNFKYLILFYTLFLISCGGENMPPKNDVKKGEGDIYYGGTFKLNIIADFKSFYPLNSITTSETKLVIQVYEGLIKLNEKDLSISPSLAEKWEVNNDATSYTFYLRKGVKFHDDGCFNEGKGREVKASDIKYCFDKICEANPNNRMFWLFKDKIVGANEYYESTKKKEPLKGGVEGIKVIDDYTLQIDLNEPFAAFLTTITHSACSIYPKEFVETYRENIDLYAVGTGPFKLKKIKLSETILLESNPSYWKVDENQNQLPYLDGINVSFIKDKRLELTEFRNGNLDMVHMLPVEMVGAIVGELKDADKGENGFYDIQVSTALQVNYMGFQHKVPPFNDVNVRKAFNYAIDKEALITYTLQGEGEPAYGGIIPPMEGFPIEKIKGYNFSLEKAKKHLAKAGFPEGKGFPEIVLYTTQDGGDINEQIARILQNMLEKNLGISIKVEVVTFNEQLELIRRGKALFWRTSWLADYPDPENFLNLLYGKNVSEIITENSYMNQMRYQSVEFDSVFNLGLQEEAKDQRYQLFGQADQIQINDAAILPISYGEHTRLLQKYVKNLSINSMNYMDFSKVYFDINYKNREQ